MPKKGEKTDRYNLIFKLELVIFLLLFFNYSVIESLKFDEKMPKAFFFQEMICASSCASSLCCICLFVSIACLFVHARVRFISLKL